MKKNKKFLTFNFEGSDEIVTFLEKLYELSPTDENRPKIWNLSRDKGVSLIIETRETQVVEMKILAERMGGVTKKEV